MIVLVKFIVCSVILMLLFHLFLAKEKSFQLNRWILLALIPVAMIIPFLSFPIFLQHQSPVQIEFIPHKFNQSSVVHQSNPSSEVVSHQHWFLIGYFTVFFILLFKKLKALHRLTVMAKNTDVLHLPGSLLILSEKALSPFSFGKYIFMHPKTYRKGSESTDMILKHERVHMAQNHHFDLIWIEFLLVVCWFNPVVYLVKRATVLNHEYLADQEVQQVAHPIKYKKLLLELSCKNNPALWTSSISASILKNRLIMMNKPSNPKNMLLKIMCFNLCTTMIIAGFSIELNAQQSTSDLSTSQKQHKWDQSFPLEEQPSFKGGMTAFNQYVANELQYPLEARQQGVEGMVEVQFVVEKDGSLSNVAAISGIGAGCDEEAVRVLRNAPHFNPGKQRGSPVRVRMVLPIQFALNSSDQTSLPSGAVQLKEVEQRNGALSVDAHYDNGRWSGSVKDPEGNGLPGANIVTKDPYVGTVTDINGKFSIKVAQSERLTISFVGYKSVKLTTN